MGPVLMLQHDGPISPWLPGAAQGGFSDGRIWRPASAGLPTHRRKNMSDLVFMASPSFQGAKRTETTC